VSVVLSLFGGLFSLPNWVINNTPFTAVPRLGSADSPLAPLAVLTILAIVIGACGLARLRGRDMTGA
jgi:ABC-2 type transport system permease protein